MVKVISHGDGKATRKVGGSLLVRLPLLPLGILRNRPFLLHNAIANAGAEARRPRASIAKGLLLQTGKMAGHHLHRYGSLFQVDYYPSTLTAACVAKALSAARQLKALVQQKSDR